MGNVIDIEKFKNAFANIGVQFQQTVEKTEEPAEEEPKRKPIAPPAATQQEEADSNTTVDGYDPDALYEQYKNADPSHSPKDKINAMRREQYQEHKDEINAQKRAAYAARKERESEE